MAQIITKDNYRDVGYDVFKKFSSQYALLSAGTIDHFNCMTLGWGMMGNIWGHPASALTVYVRPCRYTWEFMEKYDHFTVTFFPPEYREDLMTLGTLSGRDCDKLAQTKLKAVALENSVGFEQAELTFVCKKICSQQFDMDKVPEFMRKGMYSDLEPHYMYIGFIEDAFGQI